MYSDELLERVFEKTDGRCHLCGGTLRIQSYGRGGRYGWEVEHSVPLARGGSENLRNLFPAHGTCNRAKGTSDSRSARKMFGLEKRPLSRAEQDRVRGERAWLGVAIGGLLLAPLGAGAALVGAVTGAAIGHRADPE